MGSRGQNLDARYRGRTVNALGKILAGKKWREKNVIGKLFCSSDLVKDRNKFDLILPDIYCFALHT
jgi:proline racemase